MTGPTINSAEPDEDAKNVRKMLDKAQALEDTAIAQLRTAVTTKLGGNRRAGLMWYQLNVHLSYPPPETTACARLVRWEQGVMKRAFGTRSKPDGLTWQDVPLDEGEDVHCIEVHLAKAQNMWISAGLQLSELLTTKFGGDPTAFRDWYDSQVCEKLHPHRAWRVIKPYLEIPNAPRNGRDDQAPAPNGVRGDDDRERASPDHTSEPDDT